MNIKRLKNINSTTVAMNSIDIKSHVSKLRSKIKRRQISNELRPHFQINITNPELDISIKPKKTA
jgi:hypothetical protein